MHRSTDPGVDLGRHSFATTAIVINTIRLDPFYGTHKRCITKTGSRYADTKREDSKIGKEKLVSA